MNPLVIEPTRKSPFVNFLPSGDLKIEGRSTPENVCTLFDPIISFARNLICKEVNFDVNLEYFNTATSKKLLELFKVIDANNKIDSIKVTWHFEEGDDDSLEMAELYEEYLLRTDFRYLEHEEA